MRDSAAARASAEAPQPGERGHLQHLRHSAASAMIQAGVSLSDVGAVLNHKSAASTKRYAHWTTERKAVAVGKIGQKLA